MAELNPINIHAVGGPTLHYKSITEIVWDNVPGLSVLTGLNGSGKTQLLELLSYGINKISPPGYFKIPAITIGDNIVRGEVAFLPANHQFSVGQAAALTDCKQLKLNLFNQLVQQHGDVKLIGKRKRIEREIGCDDLSALGAERFAAQVSDDLLFMLNDTDLTFELAQVFQQHRLKILRLLEKGYSRDDAEKQLGPSPWQLINETLTAAAFPYVMRAPSSDTEIYAPFELALDEASSGARLQPNDLSSGEKIILETVLWIFLTKKRTAFPKLFLMDEPDAHLHPSMTQQFLNVIHEVLVKKCGIRVIITTHSPSTVALSPDGSIFEMRRSTKEIKSINKSDAISMLTAGLVTVSSGTKHIIVEDQSDIDFYSIVRDILTDQGPRKDKYPLALSPTITFLPASTGSGSNKIGGGCTVVRGWVDKFNEEPLKQLFRGLIDKDISNSDTDRVFTCKRHSIENYMLDPFNIFAVLLENGTSPTIPGLQIGVGEEHTIAECDVSILQSIVDIMTSTVSAAQPKLQAVTGNEVVAFTNGKSLQYPKWAISYRGHDLLPMFQTAWGGSSIVKPPSLLLAFKRVRLVPLDLAELLRKAQR